MIVMREFTSGILMQRENTGDLEDLVMVSDKNARRAAGDVVKLTL